MYHRVAPNVHPTEAQCIRVARELGWLHARFSLRRRRATRTVAVSASKAQRSLHIYTPTKKETSSSENESTKANGRPQSATSTVVVTSPPTPNAQAAARSLFAALNRRDVSAVLSLLSDDVKYENFGSSAVLYGRAAVGRFYLEALAALPEDAVFVLEGLDGPDTDLWVGDTVGMGVPILQAGVAWRMEVNGTVVPLSRGVGVYWADPRDGQLARIWDNPEHTVKQPAPLLASAAWASPLLRGLAPLAVPAAMSVTGFLNSLGPGGGSSSGGGSSNDASIGGLAGSVMSTLSGMMPFQPPAAASGSARSGGSGGGSGLGAAATADGGSGGSSRGAAFQDLGRGPANGSSGGRVLAAAAAAAAASTAVGGGAAGGAGMSAVAAKTQLGTAGSWSMRGSAAPSSSGGGGSGGGGSGGGDGSAGANAPARSISARAGAGPSGGPAVSNSSRGSVVSKSSGSEGPVRMRPLAPPASRRSEVANAAAAIPSASVSAAASFASVDGGPGGAAATRTKPLTATSTAAARAGSDRGAAVAKTVVPSSSVSSSSNISGSFGSVDSGSDSNTGDGGGRSLLPFPCSTSLDVNLSGLWEKDSAASQVEEYEAMLDVLELGGLQKVTARLIDGLDVQQDEQRFEVGFVTVVPFFRVTEKSQFGATTKMMRRDLRSGRQTAKATRIPGGVVVEMAWEAPLAGGLREEYVVSADGAELAVTSSLRIGRRSAGATQVYRRSGRNRKDFLASKRSSYGSLEDVLRSQEEMYGKV